MNIGGWAQRDELNVRFKCHVSQGGDAKLSEGRELDDGVEQATDPSWDP
jgi:hypothetical protein